MRKKSSGTECTKGTRGRRSVKVRAASNRLFRVSGLTSAKGDRWIKVSCGSLTGYAPYREFRGTGKGAIDKLSEHNLVLIGSEGSTVRDAVPRITRFPRSTLIEQPGRSGAHFALPSGQVTSPRGSPAPVVLFVPEADRCGTAGGGKAWFDGVCKPLAGQLLCEFMMAAVFAATIKSLTPRVGNFGFEIVGEAGVGKSTLQYLMATVAGPGVRGSAGHYWIDFNTTANALEQTMTTYTDQPLIMDEAALFAASEGSGSRGTKWKELGFRLSSGSSKSRFSLNAQAEHNFIYFTSSNRSLGEILGHAHAAELEALQDRLITLRIDDDERPNGIFDFVPDQYANASVFADALKQAAAENYGHALPRFLKRLVQRQADDLEGLKAAIQEWISEFRQATGVDLNDGSDTRVVDAFGLVYAAGQLAREFGVLPQSFDIPKATIITLNLHRRERSGRTLLRLPERLTHLSSAAGVINLDDGYPKITNVEMRGPRIFLRTSRNGRREILFNQAARDFYLPDFKVLKSDPNTRRWFKSDEGRDTSRRKVRSGHGKDAIYRFYLPPDM